jgi:hypothetical protein
VEFLRISLSYFSIVIVAKKWIGVSINYNFKDVKNEIKRAEHWSKFYWFKIEEIRTCRL